MNGHVPVLREEVLEHLLVRADGIYVDCTYGRGGHSRAILERLGPGGRLFAMDRDPAAVADGEGLARSDSRFRIEQERFGRLAQFLDRHRIAGQAAGILLDLGVSSPQLEDPARGFSFRHDGPLDMRMDTASGVSAADWLNSATERQIAQVLLRFGEEKAARRIARAVTERRRTKPINTTGELAELVATVVPARPGARHPATRTFQAIRILVNEELDDLEAALPVASAGLAIGGRLCVISFHSLEDRIVKRFMRDASRIDPALASLPVVPESARPALRLPCGPLNPGDAELAANPRARSARLRVAERL